MWRKDGIVIPARMNSSYEYIVYEKKKTSGRMIGMLYYLYVNRLENSIVNSYNFIGVIVEKRWRSSRQTEQIVVGQRKTNSPWEVNGTIKSQKEINHK